MGLPLSYPGDKFPTVQEVATAMMKDLANFSAAVQMVAFQPDGSQGQLAALQRLKEQCIRPAYTGYVWMIGIDWIADAVSDAVTELQQVPPADEDDLYPF